ncbi:zinc finger BED domain-containing protein RICESLEEPER 2-like [Alnus glutinosa]|uniref:zinc finger BED domain-containing protein RICESLEEPER 2-like n=1 Tax=Alnus glutinosa TaxID=3517 RepID=UPI002D78E25E|nr:zinc finger BED domain-containing protein RICESLEEPER 2-like [Alnus glutinosa]
MESDLHELEPIEEYENEDSLEISDKATVEATIDTPINEDPNEKNVYKRKSRKKTSTVWNHFEQVEVSDSDWRLNRRVLNFCNIPPPHSGLLIADALHKCFRDWGIESKVCSITVDNAKENDVALRHLRDVFNMRKSLVVGGKLFHVRCCAHITNLMVQDGLGEIGDIVDCVRDGIKFLVASEGRLKQFTEIAKNLHLSSKKLFLDVPTRWNSTYLMLSAAYEFKDVFSMYGFNDRQFTWVPSHEDWDKVKSVCELLGVFNRVTKIVSGSDYPTSNLFLPEIWRMKEVLIKKCDDENDYIRYMARRMKAKFDKYWSECNLLMAIAAILDPRFKLEQDLASKVQENSSSSHSIYAVDDEEGGVEMWESFLKSAETVLQPVKSKLEMYLEEGVYIPNKNIEFNALDWWKANTLKYNVLSKVAKDILSTPITTVTSESTFSAGGRVIDPHRASLSTETVQKLLCGADWVRSIYGLKKKCGKISIDKIGLGYVASASNIPSTSKTVFVKPTVPKPPTTCVDKGKEVIGGDVPTIAKATQKLPTIRRPLICHHCGLSGHIRPQCSLLKAQRSKVKKELLSQSTSATRPLQRHQAQQHQRVDAALIGTINGTDPIPFGGIPFPNSMDSPTMEELLMFDP